MLVANIRIAPNKAAVASFGGLGLTMISIKVKTKMMMVSIIESVDQKNRRIALTGESDLFRLLYEMMSVLFFGRLRRLCLSCFLCCRLG